MVFKTPLYNESDKKLNEFDVDNEFRKQEQMNKYIKIKHITKYIIKCQKLKIMKLKKNLLLLVSF